jgi:hypothetical protein
MRKGAAPFPAHYREACHWQVNSARLSGRLSREHAEHVEEALAGGADVDRSPAPTPQWRAYAVAPLLASR